MRARRLRNWSRTFAVAPADLLLPRNEQEIVAAVAQGARMGQRLKVIGALHSFNDLAGTDGVAISLERMCNLVTVDCAQRGVTVQAGMRLYTLNGHLDQLGLALENICDVSTPTIGGAIATATHGTGIRLGVMSVQVTALRMVLADGSIITCSPTQQPDLFAAASVGLGALGIVTEVTMRCVPSFHLHALIEPIPLDEVINGIEAMARENDHFQFGFTPGGEFATVHRYNRTDRPREPRPLIRSFLGDILLDNAALALSLDFRRRAPALSRCVDALAGLLRPFATPGGRVEYVDRSHVVLTNHRPVRQVVWEFALPLPGAAEAIRAVSALIIRENPPGESGVFVRFVAPDALPLSPAYGRESVYLTLSVRTGMPFETLYREAEAIVRSFGARPHWAKPHTLTAAELAPLYPEWSRFAAVRASVDPKGRFRNTYLDRVLGV